jgi:hypothetical protein
MASHRACAVVAMVCAFDPEMTVKPLYLAKQIKKENPMKRMSNRSRLSLLLVLIGAGAAAAATQTYAQTVVAAAAPAVMTDLNAFLLYANEATVLSDRASATGNVGSNTTLDLGADGRVIGSVQTRSGVTLRVRSRVEGNVTTGGSVVRQAGSVVTGVVTPNASVPNLSIPTQTVTPGIPDVILYSGQTRVLTPGAYDEIHVFTGANLTLVAGTYSVRRFVVEVNPASFKLDTTAGNITLGVREHLWLGDGVKMTFVGTGQASQVRIYSNQSSQLYIGLDSILLGNLTAPFAEARLASRATVHGSIHARRAVVDADAKLLTQ